MGALDRSLVLSGIKHCGKTTLGRLAAEAFGVPFVDTDDELEKAFLKSAGREVNTRTIFTELGETKFRQFEAEVITRMADSALPPRVIALGGGVPANCFLAPGTLKKLGFRVYLEI